MRIKRLHDFIRSAVLIVLTVIVFAGTSGLSIKAHYCNDNLSGIAFYTELGLQKPATCGCVHTSSCANLPVPEDDPVIDKMSCCSDVHFFSKLNLESPVTSFYTLNLIQPTLVDSGIVPADQLISDTEIFPDFHFRFCPPPLAGRALVLFLSQQRIPSNIYS